VVIDYVLHIAHDLGITPLGLRRHVVYRLASGLENSCWLRMQHKGYRQESLRYDLTCRSNYR
jgi:hypothetical protein